MNLTPDVLRATATASFLTAKQLYASAVSLKIGTFLFGIVTAFFGVQWWLPVLLLFLSFCADGLLMASDTRKGRGEDLLRRAEFWDGFGWAPSGRELRQVPLGHKVPDSLYFASDQTPSPARAMENLGEQAWWSRELYQRMANLLDGTLVVAVGVALLVLLLIGRGGNTGDQSVKLTIAGLNLFLSFSVLRLRLSYHRAADMARTAEQTADTLKKRYAEDPDLSDISAVRAYHAYQLGRAVAPLIPDTVYRISRTDLNARWDRRQVNAAE
jgi:hypothetical protein